MTDPLTIATEEMCDLLGFAELRLRERFPGVRASVTIPGERPVRLHFAKHGTDWGLFVEAADGQMLHVSKTGRDMRIRAAHVVSKLDDALAAENMAEMARVRAASQALKNFLETT